MKLFFKILVLVWSVAVCQPTLAYIENSSYSQIAVRWPVMVDTNWLELNPEQESTVSVLSIYGVDSLVVDGVRGIMLFGYVYGTVASYGRIYNPSAPHARKWLLASLALFPIWRHYAADFAVQIVKYSKLFPESHFPETRMSFISVSRVLGDLVQDVFLLSCCSWEYIRGATPSFVLARLAKSEYMRKAIPEMSNPYLVRALAGLDIYLGVSEALEKYRYCAALGDHYGDWVAENFANCMLEDMNFRAPRGTKSFDEDFVKLGALLKVR